MIYVLIQLNEYYDAELYASIAYECLTKPIDPEAKEVSQIAQLLAEVTYSLLSHNEATDVDMLEAEMLARKSFLINDKIYGPEDSSTVLALLTLARILMLIENHDDEVEDLLKCLLALFIRF